jgi:hypothetical protein
MNGSRAEICDGVGFQGQHFSGSLLSGERRVTSSDLLMGIEDDDEFSISLMFNTFAAL